MENFAVRFLICNLLICAIIAMLFAIKFLFRKKLTGRVQYHLWFLLLGLLAVPFLPVRTEGAGALFSWIKELQTDLTASANADAGKSILLSQAASSGWMHDFGITVSRQIPSGFGLLLFILWAAGMVKTTVSMADSALVFRAVKKASLPLEDLAVRSLYSGCLKEMKLTKDIPIYSSPFLKSPVIAGLFRPCIYLPLHLISDHNLKDIRYILLHELSHYRHGDLPAGYLMNLARAAYWFNPLVRYALKEMKLDREIACDASVLELLSADAYCDYGNTLINFADKISRSCFPFTTGLSAGMAELQKRILNIAHYQKASSRRIFCGFLVYGLTALLLAGFIPLLSVQTAGHNRCSFYAEDKDITYLDLKDAFDGQTGSFVLYDDKNDTWMIYNKEEAVTRLTPVSTYKIYDALLGLEAGIISPQSSLIAWDGQRYEYDLWNADQTLHSAMENSVTWYFQAIDRQAGFAAVKNYIREIGYGSQTAAGDLSSYWTDSTLTISPVEQVEMLKKFYYNRFGFSPENINAVKDSIYLYTKGDSSVYGKTGTGKEKEKNTLGWFVGYIEQDERVYFFATSLQNEEPACGPAAADLTLAILSELNLL